MNLVDYQIKLSDQIYDELINSEYGTYINLYGKPGSGKTVVGLDISNRLLEDWKVFYLCGINSEMSPYLTWHIGTKVFSQKKLNVDLSVSFGVPKIAAPVVEVAIPLPKIEKTNFILNSCEESIVSSIKKQTETCSRILFIVDDYDLWDIPSKQLLEKIMLKSLGILDEYTVSLLHLSLTDTIKISTDLQWKNIEIPSISDDNIRSVLCQNGFADFVDITEIKSCAGDNLHLALLAADYYQTGKVSFDDVLKERIDQFSDKDKKAVSILEPLSIIDTFFSQEEAAFFLDNTFLDNYEVVYQADEYLSVAEEHKLIEGSENYYFSNKKIRNYFRLKLEKREKMLHYQFSKFLKQRHPEDYYSRGKHIQASILNICNGTNNEAWQMLFLAYIRWSFNYGFVEDKYNILTEINELIDLNPPIQRDHQNDTLEKLLEGYSSFVKFDYKNTLLQMQSISEGLLCPALRAECLRITLLCLLQLADDLTAIKNSADSLYQLIENNDFNEDEQYCRAALVMLEVFSDRCVDTNKVGVLKEKLVKTINKHHYCSEFLALNACYNRKAALFYVAEIAYNQTFQSISFYREYNDIINLYMALCNNAANALVCGKYVAANESLMECLNMLQKYSTICFPSIYKVGNNLILLKYLQNESNSNGTDEEVIQGAKEALINFKEHLSKPLKEVSHVAYLNWLGLSILCNQNSWECELMKANEYFSDTDLFYEYYYRDLKFAGYLLQQNICAAKEELDILNEISVPLLRPYKAIFQKRRHIQTQLLENPSVIDGSAIKYHNIMKQGCFHIQDASCAFYGRGFLLSDLQFLSF